MNEILYLILFLIIICIIYYFKITEKFTVDKDDDLIYEIGNHNNLSIYKYNNRIYKLISGDIFQPFDPAKINYIPQPIRIPITITKDVIKSKFPIYMSGYKFRGLVANSYYEQYYILYEKEFDNFNMENKLSEYILVKKINNDYEIIYNVPPRDKISDGDTIYFYYGVLKIGPLVFI